MLREASLTLATIMAIMTYQPCLCATVSPMDGRKVVLMSMDGFRHDYLTKAHTPHFDALIASGVKVPYLNNTFATWTFPCHYTIATGVYEESHGIVANRMFDPLFDEIFTKSSREAKWWNGAEPVWINAVKSGRKTGVYFWPGSEVELEGHRPTKWMPYDVSTPFEERVDTVVSEWLAKDDFHFGVIYFHEPDATGHEHGPDSPEMVEAIKRMDGILGYFMEKLKAEGLAEKVDFVLTSDHGMASVDEINRRILLDDHVHSSLLEEVVIDGAVAHLRPQHGKDKELADAFRGVEHCTVYLKEEIPDRYRYKHHRRVMPVILVADEGWTIRMNKDSIYPNQHGDHGYSSDLMDMKSIFMATGPSFRTGVIGKPIKSVDIYPLLCHLLDIPPAPNNGSLARVSGLLIDDPNSGVPLNVRLYTIFLVAVSSMSSIGLNRFFLY